YSLQAWWLYSDDKMYRDDFTKAGGSVTISGSSSNIWIADQAALTDINFSGSDTWTGQLVFTSAPTGGVSPHTFTVEIGSSTNGSDFTAGGPDATITGDGSATVFTFTTDASAFSVTTGKYLALKITSNDAEYSVRTGGAWSYTSSPESSTDYTLQVTLSTFTAQFIENTPTLYWTTQSETDNIGWNIYRNDEQEFSSSTILTDEMIPGNGTTTEPSYYNYSDNENLTIGETYYYWLESIDYGGISQVYSRIAQITIPDPTVNPPDLEPPIVYNFKNVPNPVSTSSKFQFTLDKASFVSVSIYNIKGKLVKTLPLVVTTEDVEATVYWNGKDENGNIVKNGIYLYQLNVNGKTYKTNKLILMR
ncbi:MAG: T9SS type A sorting domain-containing protein, partial [Candidatus Cloacimonetes bacterium]|nr:T9SS type A sorting domain-containing protein [Candidatus Cloacimonadota bacterium]